MVLYTWIRKEEAQEERLDQLIIGSDAIESGSVEEESCGIEGESRELAEWQGHKERYPAKRLSNLIT